MKKKLYLLLGSILFLQYAIAQKKILFIGNSYIYVNDLPKVIQNISYSLGDSIIYQTYAIGGQTAMGHWNDTALHSIIKQGNWDYVVIQCQSQEPSFAPSQVASDTYPYVKKLDSLIQATNTCAETMFFMTWGRKNGDAANCPFYPVICTFDGMNGRLRESYLQFANDFTASFSPVGVAWKNCRTANPTLELYQTDESHPSENGTYLAACVFYTSIFHKSCNASNYILGSITNANASFIRNIATNTVLDSIENWQGNSNLPFANFSNSIVSNSVTFSNNSKRYTSIAWDFGDGNSSTLLNPTHTYASIGNYNVCVTALSSCGKQDKICKTIAITSTTPNAIDKVEANDIIILQHDKQITIQTENNNLYYEWLNIFGQCIEKGNIENKQLDFSNNASGLYLLNVYSGFKKIKSIKIAL